MDSEKIIVFDERRRIAIPGDREETIRFAVDHLVAVGKEAIKKRGRFVLALSGGSTPKAVYRLLATSQYRHSLDSTKVHLLWSDERAVPPEDEESNYHMAMTSGLKTLGIPEDHIHRMQAEDQIEKHAKEYQDLIKRDYPIIDLIMLGMGEDGHTASLFPGTKALENNHDLVAPNYVPQKTTWRMTFTLKEINQSENIVFYVIGEQKAEMAAKVFQDTTNSYPAAKVGTPAHNALWIVDHAAAADLSSILEKRKDEQEK